MLFKNTKMKSVNRSIAVAMKGTQSTSQRSENSLFMPVARALCKANGPMVTEKTQKGSILMPILCSTVDQECADYCCWWNTLLYKVVLLFLIESLTFLPLYMNSIQYISIFFYFFRDFAFLWNDSGLWSVSNRSTMDTILFTNHQVGSCTFLVVHRGIPESCCQPHNRLFFPSV